MQPSTSASPLRLPFRQRYKFATSGSHVCRGVRVKILRMEESPECCMLRALDPHKRKR